MAKYKRPPNYAKRLQAKTKTSKRYNIDRPILTDLVSKNSRFKESRASVATQIKRLRQGGYKNVGASAVSKTSWGGRELTKTTKKGGERLARVAHNKRVGGKTSFLLTTKKVSGKFQQTAHGGRGLSVKKAWATRKKLYGNSGRGKTGASKRGRKR